MNRLASWFFKVVFVGFALLAVKAQALSIGELSVYSAPKEPFRAALVIKNLGKIPYRSLQVSTPSAQALQALGLKSADVAKYRYRVLAGQKNSAIVYISSQQKIMDTAALALQLRWPGGRKIAGFTVDLEAIKPRYGWLYKVSDRAASQPRYQKRARFYGPVQPGDTLWKIAKKLRPNQNISVSQMMIALFAENPRAFKAQDINRLQKGQVLWVPKRAQVAKIARTAAIQMVREELRTWRLSQNRLQLQPAFAVKSKPAMVTRLKPKALKPIAKQAPKRPQVIDHTDLALLQELAIQMQTLQTALHKMQQNNQNLHQELAGFQTQLSSVTERVELQTAQAASIEAQAVLEALSDEAIQAPTEVSDQQPSATKLEMLADAGAIQQATAMMPEDSTTDAQPALFGVFDQAKKQGSWSALFAQDAFYWSTGSFILVFLMLLWLTIQWRREHARRLEDQEILKATVDRMQNRVPSKPIKMNNSQ